MKTVKIVSLALISTFVLFSCKNSEKSNPEIEIFPEKDLAVIDSGINEEIILENYLYVTASTGLSLREYANLQSDKLAIMPYGAKVKVITAEENLTMSISGIKGGMNQIEYNHKKGFAFNGYLSKFFPPEKGISSKGYADELKLSFPKVIFTEVIGGTVSKPTNTKTLLLPTTQWHDAFFIAQKLFDIPLEFTFPPHKGKENQILKDRKPKKSIWVSELHISRQENELTKIEYLYKTKGFLSNVTIIKDVDVMKLSKTEVVE